MTNQLELRDFECFTVLAETLHYGKAADKLHITQSALSQKIQRFEAIVGQSLFDRTNRKVVLNDAGQHMLHESKIILQQVKRSMERWKLSVSGTHSLIRIGFVGSAMQVFLPPIIQKMSKERPEITFRLEDLSNKDQLAALDQMQLDVGFIRSDNVPAHIRIKSVHQENFSIVLPKDYPLDEDQFKGLEQLANEPFILFPNEISNQYFKRIIRLCQQAGFYPKISHRSIDGPTIFKLVESHLGISVIANSLRDLRNDKIKYIELKNAPLQTELFAVWHEDNENPALQYFLNLIDGFKQ